MSSKQHRLAEERALLQGHGEQTVICELEGSLFFGTTDQLFTDLAPDLKRCRYLILDWRRVRSVDYTAAHMLEQFEAMLAERGGYLLFSRMPASLPSGQDVAAYFSHVGVTGPANHVQRFETLDDALRWAEDRILTEAGANPRGDDGRLELREADLFREFADDGNLDFIAAGVTERSCAAGERIFARGDHGDELFIVRRGIVRVALPLKDGSYHNLAFFGRGSFFGEMVFLDRGIRSADATATAPTDLFVISRQRFDAVVRAHPLAGVKVFARLSRALALRLRDTDAELQALYAA
jgi:SulP family sulfate permease